MGALSPQGGAPGSSGPGGAALPGTGEGGPAAGAEAVAGQQGRRGRQGRHVLRVEVVAVFEVEVLAGSTRQALALARGADPADLRAAARADPSDLDPAVEAVAAVGGRVAVEHLRVLAPGEDFDPLT